MSGLLEICVRTQRLGLKCLAAFCLLTLSASDVEAQQYVGQDGRMLDANPQVGGGRYNYSRPVSPLVGGNAYATGNVGRGFSLHSYSPIESPFAFRAPLGSGALSSFIRDSVSVADQASPYGGLVPRYFFDPVRTAPTGAYLSGYYDARPPVPALGPSYQRTSASPFDDLAPYGSPPRLRSDTAISGQLPSGSLGAPLNTELSSTIFGVERPRLPDVFSNAAPLTNLSYLPEVGEEGAFPAGTQAPLDLRVAPETFVQSLPTPLDVLRQDEAIGLLTDRTMPGGSRAGQQAAPTVPGATGIPPVASRRPGDVAAAGAVPGAAGLRDASMLPGQDVFTDMRLALELSLNPNADWYAEMLKARGEIASETPTDSLERQRRTAEAATEFLTRVFESPVQTFAGQGATAANEELRQAEADMELGRYYDAVRHYERARVLDPVNPLPMIGKGHALLAAGEYVSAAVALVSGLDGFPELARFQIDLSGLMGGGEIVDIRRADIMKQLARNEDPQLRFLLGYLEIHAGMPALGMENLERAASEALPGTLIRRYPNIIRHKGVPTLSEPAVEEGQAPALPSAGEDQDSITGQPE